MAAGEDELAIQAELVARMAIRKLERVFLALRAGNEQAAARAEHLEVGRALEKQVPVAEARDTDLQARRAVHLEQGRIVIARCAVVGIMQQAHRIRLVLEAERVKLRMQVVGVMIDDRIVLDLRQVAQRRRLVPLAVDQVERRRGDAELDVLGNLFVALPAVGGKIIGELGIRSRSWRRCRLRKRTEQSQP